MPKANWDESILVSDALRKLQEAKVSIPMGWDIKTILQIYNAGYDVGYEEGADSERCDHLD